MSASVLLTVGVLGAGFVVLSKERAKLAANPAPVTDGAGLQAAANGVDAVSGADPRAAAPEGGAPPVQCAEDGCGGIVDPNAGNSGADPTVSPSTPAPHAATERQASPNPAVMVSDYKMIDTSGSSAVAAKYGSGGSKLPNYQQSRALSELGPLSGGVW